MKKIIATSVISAVLANLITLSVVAWALLARAYSADFYYQSVQEDGVLEWMTFWVFLLATVAFLRRSQLAWRANSRLPWFETCLALFCFFVAMEEISWAQRLAGFGVPEYFLANNFQQELNLHNTISIELRKLTLLGVILGYGLILPLLALFPGRGQRLEYFGVRAPSYFLVPAFVAIFCLYLLYPINFSGELIELMLGFCFLFAAIGIERSGISADHQGIPGWLWIVFSSLLICALGWTSSVITMALVKADPVAVAATRTESAALARDLQNLRRAKGGLQATKCGLHMRVFSYVEHYHRYDLLAGEYSELQRQGLPEARASFFIDPWGGPYWIQHSCTQDGSRHLALVYSFGPNRRRDSSAWEVLGDDIAALYFESGRQ